MVVKREHALEELPGVDFTQRPEQMFDRLGYRSVKQLPRLFGGPGSVHRADSRRTVAPLVSLVFWRVPPGLTPEQES